MLYIRKGLAVFCFLLTANLVQAENMQPAEMIDQSHPRARLIVGSEALYKKVRLIKARVVPLGKLMRGQATVQNLSNERLSLEYRIDWYDDEGFIIGDGGIWQRFSLGASELRPFKSLGKSKYAARMQFTVRYPGDTFIDSQSRWEKP